MSIRKDLKYKNYISLDDAIERKRKKSLNFTCSVNQAEQRLRNPGETVCS